MGRRDEPLLESSKSHHLTWTLRVARFSSPLSTGSRPSLTGINRPRQEKKNICQEQPPRALPGKKPYDNTKPYDMLSEHTPPPLPARAPSTLTLARSEGTAEHHGQHFRARYRCRPKSAMQPRLLNIRHAPPCIGSPLLLEFRQDSPQRATRAYRGEELQLLRLLEKVRHRYIRGHAHATRPRAAHRRRRRSH